MARLQAGNRPLMNSLLGTAGFPPVDFPEATKPRRFLACANEVDTRSKRGVSPGPSAMPQMISREDTRRGRMAGCRMVKRNPLEWLRYSSTILKAFEVSDNPVALRSTWMFAGLSELVS